MFGAYEAGVWSALEGRWRPDLIVGASIGALNGWAFAGGCPGARWLDEWLNLTQAAELRWRWSGSLAGGLIDREGFEGYIRSVHERFQPRTPYALTVTDMHRMEPKLVEGAQVDWRHLAASCAVPLVMPLYRIDGRWLGDGGLLESVPIWAAEQLGATRIVAVNILPLRPVWYIRHGRRVLRGLSGWRPQRGSSRVIRLTPDPPLGGPREMVYWTRANAERMIDAGRRDAEAAMDRLLDL
jgi:NTE family protein